MTVTRVVVDETTYSNVGALAYRVEIDGLRALAVLAVIANHYQPDLLPLGYLGVDVFFVISGFVIAGAISGRTEKGFGAFLTAFYARRLKRLLPALVLCVIVSALLISFFSPLPGGYLKTGLFALFGLSNLWLHHQSSDYFADSMALNPFTHTWSLGVEEQFYLLFPVLMWVGMRKVGLRRMALALAVLSALSFLAWSWMAAQDPMAAFYLPVFRGWELGLGAVLYLMNLETKGWMARHASVLKLAGVVLVVTVMTGLAPISRDAALVSVVVLTGGLLALTGPEAASLRFLSSAPAVYLGRTSYSLYLWHWPVMVLMIWTIGFGGPTVWLALGLTLGLAHLSYTYIEQPARHSSWGQTKRRECMIGAGIVGFAALAIVGLSKAPKAVYLGQPAALEASGVASLSMPYITRSGAVWAGEPCLLTSNDEVGKSLTPETCVVGAPLAQAEQRLLVIGNSFSASFLQAFDGLQDHASDLEGMSIIVTSSWGASLAPGMPNTGAWSEANDYYWAEVIPTLLEQLTNGDQVMIVSDLAGFSPPPTASAEELGARAALREAAEDALRNFSQELATRNIELSVLGPLPFARDVMCTPEQAVEQWFARAGATCSFFTREETRARMAPTADMLIALETAGYLRVLDIFDYFCDTILCDYVDAAGQLLYRDVFSHPSVEAARAVRPFLAQHLSEAMK